tara:strand:+ start:2142 stop:2489 length:348 start_codon:yes stop_codon:yes gene_type:complete
MARIIIQNAEITRVMAGHGFQAETNYLLKSGDTKTEKYTVWTQEQFQVGQVVNIEGLHSVKMEEFTNQQGEEIKYARAHVNNPNVTLSQNGSGKVKEAAIMDTWPTATIGDQAAF